MFYTVIKNLAYFISRILFKVRFEGLENIPEDGRYIISSNHRSYFDPIFLAAKEKKHMKFMAKSELFDVRVLGWLIAKLGAFPVSRGSGDEEPINKAVESLQSGSPLLIFPEGTRSRTGVPKRARSGVALIAGKAEVGALPVSIDYGKKLRFRTRVTVRYHAIIPYEDLNIDLDSPRTLRTASKMIMDSIVSGLTHLPELESREDAA